MMPFRIDYRFSTMQAGQSYLAFITCGEDTDPRGSEQILLNSIRPGLSLQTKLYILIHHVRVTHIKQMWEV